MWPSTLHFTQMEGSQAQKAQIGAAPQVWVKQRQAMTQIPSTGPGSRFRS